MEICRYYLTGTVVAFNVNGLNVLSNHVNAFPTVNSNEGNAYNACNEHFTAPVDGIYYFSAQICVYDSGSRHDGYFAIENGQCKPKRGGIALTFTYRNNQSSSASSSVKLTRNEQVWVSIKVVNPGSLMYVHSNYWNTFTGTLIQDL
ncbi:hypothetical protein DPMN_069263 [Dreissena polymorpha]|uniref:C1q domain-containing protein n=1 Tax=Dreissena polymorpha TaxID=45954 RepID=A0A9D3YZ55_DREPO|nr:hypothetical protein DPMN_069263 [Dreissena polymorpha]